MSDSVRPPTPDGLPVLGNSLAFNRDPFGAISGWAGTGDVVRLEFPGRDLYLLTEPELIREVLVERAGEFTISDDQQAAFAGIEDRALTSASGDRWARLRRSLQPAFRRDAIEGYGLTMAGTTADVVGTWSDGEGIDLLRQMRLAALTVLGETLLSTDLRKDADVVFAAADAVVDRANFQRPGQLLPGWVPTPTDRRFRRRVGALDDLVEEILAERQAAGDGERDVASVLLESHADGNLSREEVRHNLVAILLGGHDSAATAMTYAWYLLSDDPGVLEGLQTEVDEVVADGLPTAADRDALASTERVVRETLRLYPPAWATPRKAPERVELGGYEVPAGATIVCPQWVLHRDPRFWDDPETFDPSRWEGDADRPEYAYFPFSGGPRHCIGMHFARQELQLALATMVREVALDVSLDGPLEFTPSLTLRPETEMRATVRRR